MRGCDAWARGVRLGWGRSPGGAAPSAPARRLLLGFRTNSIAPCLVHASRRRLYRCPASPEVRLALDVMRPSKRFSFSRGAPTGTLLLAVLACLGSSSAPAVLLDAHAGAAFMDYRLRYGDIVASDGTFADGLEIKDQIFVGSLGATVSQGAWFADISAQVSADGSDRGTQFLMDIEEDRVIGATHEFGSDFERRELSVLAGRVFDAAASAVQLVPYVGYRDATLSFENSVTTVGPLVDMISNDLLLPGELYRGAFAQKFEYNGFFMGMTVAIPFAELGGALSISPALSRFESRVTQRFHPDPDARPTQLGSVDFSGRSAGLFIGIDWTWFLSDRLRLSVGIDRSDFELKKERGDVLGGFDEEISRLKMRLSATL